MCAAGLLRHGPSDQHNGQAPTFNKLRFSKNSASKLTPRKLIDVEITRNPVQNDYFPLIYIYIYVFLYKAKGREGERQEEKTWWHALTTILHRMQEYHENLMSQAVIGDSAIQ